jgi:hypothetical protein
MEHQLNCIACCAYLGIIGEYDPSILDGYHLVNQYILYAPFHLYFFLYPIRTAQRGELFVINFIMFVLLRFWSYFFATNHSVAYERTKFGIL